MHLHLNSTFGFFTSFIRCARMEKLHYYWGVSGGRKLCRDGYVYNKGHVIRINRNQNTVWECERECSHCPARIIVRNNSFVVSDTQNHNHEREAFSPETRE